MKRRGFTLIELLVVIAIIAILASILFPVFAKARDKARGTLCLSNGKQLALAVQMYLDDWEETFPIYNIADYTRWTGIGLDPYVRNSKIFKCPNSGWPDNYIETWAVNRNVAGIRAGGGGFDTGAPAPANAYHWSMKLGDFYRSDVAAVPIILDIGCQILLTEFMGTRATDFYADGNMTCTYYDANDTPYNVNLGTRAGVGAAQIEGQWRRHNKGTTVCFCDGHAQWMQDLRNWMPNTGFGMLDIRMVAQPMPSGHVQWWVM